MATVEVLVTEILFLELKKASKHNTHRVNISNWGGQHDQHIHVCCPVFQGLVCCHIKILSAKDLQKDWHKMFIEMKSVVYQYHFITWLRPEELEWLYYNIRFAYFPIFSQYMFDCKIKKKKTPSRLMLWEVGQAPGVWNTWPDTEVHL